MIRRFFTFLHFVYFCLHVLISTLIMTCILRSTFHSIPPVGGEIIVPDAPNASATLVTGAAFSASGPATPDVVDVAELPHCTPETPPLSTRTFPIPDLTCSGASSFRQEPVSCAPCACFSSASLTFFALTGTFRFCILRPCRCPLMPLKSFYSTLPLCKHGTSIRRPSFTKIITEVAAVRSGDTATSARPPAMPPAAPVASFRFILFRHFLSRARPPHCRILTLPVLKNFAFAIGREYSPRAAAGAAPLSPSADTSLVLPGCAPRFYSGFSSHCIVLGPQVDSHSSDSTRGEENAQRKFKTIQRGKNLWLRKRRPTGENKHQQVLNPVHSKSSQQGDTPAPRRRQDVETHIPVERQKRTGYCGGTQSRLTTLSPKCNQHTIALPVADGGGDGHVPQRHAEIQKQRRRLRSAGSVRVSSALQRCTPTPERDAHTAQRRLRRTKHTTHPLGCRTQGSTRNGLHVSQGGVQVRVRRVRTLQRSGTHMPQADRETCSQNDKSRTPKPDTQTSQEALISFQVGLDEGGNVRGPSVHTLQEPQGEDFFVAGRQNTGKFRLSGIIAFSSSRGLGVPGEHLDAFEEGEVTEKRKKRLKKTELSREDVVSRALLHADTLDSNLISADQGGRQLVLPRSERNGSHSPAVPDKRTNRIQAYEGGLWHSTEVASSARGDIADTAGVRLTEASSCGDVVGERPGSESHILAAEEEKEEGGTPVEVLFQSEHLLVLNKPGGMSQTAFLNSLVRKSIFSSTAVRRQSDKEEGSSSSTIATSCTNTHTQQAGDGNRIRNSRDMTADSRRRKVVSQSNRGSSTREFRGVKWKNKESISRNRAMRVTQEGLFTTQSTGLVCRYLDTFDLEASGAVVLFKEIENASPLHKDKAKVPLCADGHSHAKTRMHTGGSSMRDSFSRLLRRGNRLTAQTLSYMMSRTRVTPFNRRRAVCSRFRRRKGLIRLKARSSKNVKQNTGVCFPESDRFSGANTSGFLRPGEDISVQNTKSERIKQFATDEAFTYEAASDTELFRKGGINVSAAKPKRAASEEPRKVAAYTFEKVHHSHLPRRGRNTAAIKERKEGASESTEKNALREKHWKSRTNRRKEISDTKELLDSQKIYVSVSEILRELQRPIISQGKSGSVESGAFAEESCLSRRKMRDVTEQTHTGDQSICRKAEEAEIAAVNGRRLQSRRKREDVRGRGESESGGQFLNIKKSYFKDISIREKLHLSRQESNEISSGKLLNGEEESGSEELRKGCPVVKELRSAEEISFRFLPFSSDKVDIIYLAVVAGHMPLDLIHCRASICKPSSGCIDYRLAGTRIEGSSCYSIWRPVNPGYYKGSPATLTEIRHVEGPPPTVRLHAACLGFPIIGDSLYATSRRSISEERKSLALSCERLLLHSWIAKIGNFSERKVAKRNPWDESQEFGHTEEKKGMLLRKNGSGESPERRGLLNAAQKCQQLTKRPCTEICGTLSNTTEGLRFEEVIRSSVDNHKRNAVGKRTVGVISQDPSQNATVVVAQDSVSREVNLAPRDPWQSFLLSDSVIIRKYPFFEDLWFNSTDTITWEDSVDLLMGNSSCGEGNIISRSNAGAGKLLLSQRYSDNNTYWDKGIGY